MKRYSVNVFVLNSRTKGLLELLFHHLQATHEVKKSMVPKQRMPC